MIEERARDSRENGAGNPVQFIMRDQVLFPILKANTIIFRPSFPRQWPILFACSEIALLLARHDRWVLAGAIIALSEKGAFFLHGASSSDFRNCMAPYALHWEAMRYARSRGCRWYDMGAVSPCKNPGHPFFGLYRPLNSINHSSRALSVSVMKIFLSLIQMIIIGKKSGRIGEGIECCPLTCSNLLCASRA